MPIKYGTHPVSSMMNMDENIIDEPSHDLFTPADRWILSAANTLAKDVTDNMDKFELGIAVQKVYDFIWDEFCDWYVEMAKFRIYHKEEAPEAANCALWVLKTVLAQAIEAASSVYAVYDRGDLRGARSGGRVAYDVRVAEIQRRVEFCAG